MLSVIIPARNEIYLENTIKNVLENAEGEIEVLVMLDGWIPEPQIVTNDPRVIFYHEPTAIGQRASINKGAKLAKGDYVMKLDAHCAVDKGFDVKLAADCEPDWTVIPRMYNLDPETWKPRFFEDFERALKMGKVHDYMYMGWNSKNEFRTLYYSGMENKLQHHNDRLIDDTMSCMGPCFFMRKDRFWELGGCDEEHGSWGQQGIEVSCKAWLSGGSLKVNKKTWFAHWFRGGGGPGWPYPISDREINHARDYSKDLWLNDKWPLQKRKFQWLLDKFNPPGWKEKMASSKDKKKITELNLFFYRHNHIMRHEPTWKGVRVIKMPSDMMLYHQIIWENKPDFIIDSGTKFGGSALFFQDMLDLTGKGKVISIDKYPVKKEKDPRITYIEAGSTDSNTLQTVRDMVGTGTVMVVLDSDHHRRHVKRELFYYAPIVTKGQYMVIEDCYDSKQELTGPGEARDWFLRRNRDFILTDVDKQYLIGYCRDGWLKKVK